MTEYTVIGLYNTASREFLVAGVIEGAVSCVDTESGESEWQRIAHEVEAPDPDGAARAAAELVNRES